MCRYSMCVTKIQKSKCIENTINNNVDVDKNNSIIQNINNKVMTSEKENISLFLLAKLTKFNIKTRKAELLLAMFIFISLIQFYVLFKIISAHMRRTNQ